MAGIKIFDTDDCEWSDVRVDVAAARILQLTGIKWGSKIDKKYQYGEGNKPRAIRHGNRENMGELKVRRGVLRDMNVAAVALGYPDILEFSFPIIVKYRAKGGRKQELITLVDAEFTEFNDEMLQGAAESEVTLPIMFLEAKQVVTG